MKFSQNGHHLAFSPAYDDIFIIDLAHQQVTARLALNHDRGTGDFELIKALDYVISPDGLLLVVRQLGRLRFLDFADIIRLSQSGHPPDTRTAEVTALAISPDSVGTYLAYAIHDSMVTVLNRASEARIARWRVAPECDSEPPVDALAISHDDSMLAVAFIFARGCYGLKVYRLCTGKLLMRSKFRLSLMSYYSMAFTPKDDMIAFLKGSHHVQLLDIELGRILDFSKHKRALRAAETPALICGVLGLGHATISSEGDLVPAYSIQSDKKVEQFLFCPSRSLCPRSDWLTQIPSTAFGTVAPAYLTFINGWLQLGRVKLLYLPEEWRPSFTSNNVHSPRPRAICTAIIRGSTVIWGSRKGEICSLTLDLNHPDLACLRSLHEDAADEAPFYQPAVCGQAGFASDDPSTGVSWQDLFMELYGGSDDTYDGYDSDEHNQPPFEKVVPWGNEKYERHLDEEERELWSQYQEIQEDEDSMTETEWKTARRQRADRLEAAWTRARRAWGGVAKKNGC